MNVKIMESMCLKPVDFFLYSSKSERILSKSEEIFRFYFCRKNPKPLYFLTFLQIRLKLQCSYSIIFETIKSNRIQEIVI